MTVLRAGVAQLTTGIDPEAAAEALAAALNRLADLGADVAFTPEMSGRLDRDRARLLAGAHDEAHDPALAAARRVAGERGIRVALGSLAIREQGERLVNRSFVIGAEGEVVARYDKLHLFDVDLPDGTRIRESDTFAPGDAAVAVRMPWGALGLSVCYDVRFPALYAALAGAGARVLAVPAAFTVPTGEAHWHTLLRARAIETGSFVVAAAQTGLHEDGRRTFGHSLVVDPWGAVLLDMGAEPGEAVAELDLGEVETARARIPALAHARDFTLTQA